MILVSLSFEHYETIETAMSTKQQLEQLFGEIPQSKWNAAAKQRKENRQWLNYSQEIALAVLEQLDQKNITQKALAERLSVSPQLVNKWMKGSENFTLETISKIEAVLEIRLLNIEIKNEGIPISVEIPARQKVEYKNPVQNISLEKSFKTARIISMPKTDYIKNAM